MFLVVIKGTAAGIVTVTVPRKSRLLGFAAQGVCAVLSGDPNFTTGDLTSATADRIDSSCFAFTSTAGSTIRNSVIFEQGEIIYCAFSGKGSAAIYLDELT